MSFKDTLAAHARANKITPGQQVNLLIYYLGLQVMFPEITFERYLERSLAVAGATEANRKFPKDALDEFCPNKGSQWEPDERIDMMITYLELKQLLAAENLPDMSFADFLAEEAPRYKGEPPPTPGDAFPPIPVTPNDTFPAATPAGSVAEAPPQMAPPGGFPAEPATPKRSRAKKSEVVANPLAALVPNSRWALRVPDGPVLTGTIMSAGEGVWAFRSDQGEDITVIDATQFEALSAETPPPPAPANLLQQTLQLTPDQVTVFEQHLAMSEPLASIGIGDPILRLHQQFNATDTVVVDLINAQPKPTIDAYLARNGRVISEAAPRHQSPYGIYDFVVGEETFRLEVTR